MTVEWDGITRAETLGEEANAARQWFADAARAYDWRRVFETLRQEPRWINAWRPGGSSWFAALHQAAYGGAARGVVEELIDLGAWRSLRDASGRRAVDLARERGHAHLTEGLAPRLCHHVEVEVLDALQARLHDLILERSGAEVRRHRLRLPELAPMLELNEPEMWFPVPGMYGGFKLRLTLDAAPILVVESWSRVVEGSGQRHEITASTCRLVEEGFV